MTAVMMLVDESDDDDDDNGDDDDDDDDDDDALIEAKPTLHLLKEDWSALMVILMTIMMV